MSRSPAISGALLILALCIVIEVSSAPREERIPDSSGQEKFLQTRETELLELTQEARHEISHESREHEVQRRIRFIREPLPPSLAKKSLVEAATKKPVIGDKSNDDSALKAEASEAKDMTHTHVSPKDDDETAPAATLPKVPETTEKNSSSEKPSTNKISADLPHTPIANDNVTTSISTVDTHSTDVPAEGKPSVTTDHTINVETPKTTEVTPSSATPTTTSVVTSEPSVASSPTSTTIATSTSTVSTVATTTTTTTTTTTEKPLVITIETTPTTTATTTTTEVPVTVTTSSSVKSEVITNNPVTLGSTEMSEAEKLLHSKPAPPPASMPSGVVALITAIAFAIVAVLAYVGLVVWRRYLEWRYGNRELLVNEFDSNDIGNFEL